MRSIFALLLTAVLTTAGAAQVVPDGSGPMVRDRVVAVVGDTVLHYSDILEALGQARAAGQLPQEPAALDAFTDQVIEDRINDLIIVSAAREAGITVSEDQVNAQVQQQIRDVQRQFGSELALTNALAEAGLTRDQYQRELANQFRDQLLINEFLQMRMRSRARPVINERDIEAFFESQRANLGRRPASVAFRQVVVTPQPSPEAREAAIARAQEVLQELRTGADFTVLARRFSEDEGTREHGGDLGWFREDRMVPEFARAAFSLRPGQTSGIVETEYGFHIIRVERARGAERQARHILIRADITERDIEVARQRADSVASAIRGGESIATLATRYNRSEFPSTINELVDRLPPDYAAALANAAPGDLIGPISIQDPIATRWAVIRVTEKVEAGEVTLNDVREQIRTRLQQQGMMEQLLEELRDQVYVRIL